MSRVTILARGCLLEAWLWGHSPYYPLFPSAYVALQACMVYRSFADRDRSHLRSGVGMADMSSLLNRSI
jgi:hypothetical protein